MKREDVHLGIYLSHFFSFHVHFILRKDFSWKERGHKEEGGKGKHCSLERVSRLSTILSSPPNSELCAKEILFSPSPSSECAIPPRFGWDIIHCRCCQGGRNGGIEDGHTTGTKNSPSPSPSFSYSCAAQEKKNYFPSFSPFPPPTSALPALE